MTGTRFLDPVVLARISNLELLARTVVDGFISGLHHAPYLGVSTDFAEHRQYLPGDDIRRIDWRVYGRTDRLYVKEFEADTNADFLVLLDVSRSMDYATHGVTKLEYGKFLAASLVYLSRHQRDRVGLVAFDREIVAFVPASAKHLEIVLHTLDRLAAGGPGDLEPPITRAAEAIKRRSMLAVISDFYAEPQTVADALGMLKHKGNDVMAFHLLDASEVAFPFAEPARFMDLESGDRVPVVPEKIRELYDSQITDHRAQLQRRLHDVGVEYCFVDTNRPLDHVLFEYLVRRERLAHVR